MGRQKNANSETRQEEVADDSLIGHFTLANWHSSAKTPMLKFSVNAVLAEECQFANAKILV